MLFQQVHRQLLGKYLWIGGPIGRIPLFPFINRQGVCFNQFRPSVFNDTFSHLLGHRAGLAAFINHCHGFGQGEVPFQGVHIVYRQPLGLICHGLMAKAESNGPCCCAAANRRRKAFSPLSIAGSPALNALPVRWRGPLLAAYNRLAWAIARKGM